MYSTIFTVTMNVAKTQYLCQTVIHKLVCRDDVSLCKLCSFSPVTTATTLVQPVWYNNFHLETTSNNVST